MPFEDVMIKTTRRLVAGTVDARILRATLLVGSLTVLAKVAATAKEIFVASSFGRSDVVDAFLIAFLVPQTVISVGGACFSASLVPVFAKVQVERGERQAEALLTKTLVASEALLIAFSVLVGICAPLVIHILGSSFSPAKRALTCQLSYWLLPSVVLNGFTAITGSILNVHRRFLITSVTPVVTPGITLLAIVFEVHRWGIWALVVGTVAGYVCEAIIILIAYLGAGFRLRWGSAELNGDVKAILIQYLPLLGGGMLTGGISLVDQSMTATLAAGSVAAFAYGTKVVNVILMVVTGSLSTVLIPHFSEMLAQGDWRGCERTIRVYSRLLMAICVPLTIGMIAFSHPMIRGLYQHGAFRPSDTVVVSAVQIAYAISIPFASLGIIHVRFLSSVRRNELLLLSGFQNLVLDIILDIILGKMFGVAGIALATTLFYIASCALLIYLSGREMRRFRQGRVPLPSCG